MSIKLKLISPISAKCDAPYENPWDGGEDYSIMTEIEKIKCQKEISEAVCQLIMPKNSRRGLMNNFNRQSELDKKVFSAVPTVEENNGRLVLILNCKCFKILIEQELDEFCIWWENQVVRVNEILKNSRVPTKKFGKIYVYIWFIKGWAIEPEFVIEPND